MVAVLRKPITLTELDKNEIPNGKSPERTKSRTVLDNILNRQNSE